MTSFRRLVALTSLLLALVSFSSCRTKSSKKPKTTPVATTDSVPDVGLPPATDTSTPVEPHDRDFVKETPAVHEEELPTDLAELNRVAQERGLVRDAFFQYDASTLSTDAQEALTTSASWLKSHPQYSLLVEGHCDARGTQQYNLALGDRRANTAKDYLVTLGIDSGRIRTVSYGKERPFNPAATEEGYAANRRAHLVIEGK